MCRLLPNSFERKSMKPKTLGDVCCAAFYGEPVFDPPYTEDWSRAARAVVREHEKRQWRPIESAPDDKYILVWCNNVVIRAYRWHGDWYRSARDYVSMEPSHWRPLPKGPKL